MRARLSGWPVFMTKCTHKPPARGCRRLGLWRSHPVPIRACFTAHVLLIGGCEKIAINLSIESERMERASAATLPAGGTPTPEAESLAKGGCHPAQWI